MQTFVDRHGLWTDTQQQQARELVGRIDAGELDLVRFAWPDQHGMLRGKTLVASEARGQPANWQSTRWSTASTPRCPKRA